MALAIVGQSKGGVMSWKFYDKCETVAWWALLSTPVVVLATWAVLVLVNIKVTVARALPALAVTLIVITFAGLLQQYADGKSSRVRIAEFSSRR